MRVKLLEVTQSQLSYTTDIDQFVTEIGTWALNNGYKGLIVPGARGNKDYSNILIFTQLDVNNALGGIIPNIINN